MRRRNDQRLRAGEAYTQLSVDAQRLGLATSAMTQALDLPGVRNRVRTLMSYVPRKYDPAIIEALAINGALKPTLDSAGRAKAIAKVAAWLDAADPEAGWTGPRGRREVPRHRSRPVLGPAVPRCPRPSGAGGR